MYHILLTKHVFVYTTVPSIILYKRRNVARYEKEHRKELNQRRYEQIKQKEQAMTPEEYSEYRQKVNAKARENYQKRKAKKSEESK